MSTLRFFDAHTHTHFAAFSNDQDEVIKRALDAGVSLVNVGTQKDTSKKAIETAERYVTGVYATVGLHPIHTFASFHDPQELGGSKGFNSRGEEFDYEYYKELATHPKLVAIGECGLDYYRVENIEQKPLQEKAFRAQIELSLEIKKPLMIHCRNAFQDLITILNSYFLIPDSFSPGIIHFFSGKVDDAKNLLALGFSFTFGGVITFARDYDEVIRMIPLERILTETDAPYVTPAPYRGKRNEPLYIVEVVKKISEIKGISFEETAERTFENARKIFRV